MATPYSEIHNVFLNKITDYDILKYLENGGTDLNVVKGKVMDGIYESRI